VRLHLSVAILIFGVVLGGCERDDKIVDLHHSEGGSALQHPATPTIDTSRASSRSEREFSGRFRKAGNNSPAMARCAMRVFLIWPEHPEIQATVVPLGAESADVLPNVNAGRDRLACHRPKAGDLGRGV